MTLATGEVYSGGQVRDPDGREVITISAGGVGPAGPTGPAGPAGPTGPAGMSKVASYGPSSTATWAATASSADLDATHLTLTFVAPATGNVLVLLNAWFVMNAAKSLAWTVRSAGSDVGMSSVGYNSTPTDWYARATALVPVTGLTPGNSYTFTWGQIGDATPGAATTANNGALGPAVMKIEAF